MRLGAQDGPDGLGELGHGEGLAEEAGTIDEGKVLIGQPGGIAAGLSYFLPSTRCTARASVVSAMGFSNSSEMPASLRVAALIE